MGSIVSCITRVMGLTVLPQLVPELSVGLIGAVAAQHCVCDPWRSPSTSLLLVALKICRMCRGWWRLCFVMRTFANRSLRSRVLIILHCCVRPIDLTCWQILNITWRRRSSSVVYDWNQRIRSSLISIVSTFSTFHLLGDVSCLLGSIYGGNVTSGPLCYKYRLLSSLCIILTLR